MKKREPVSSVETAVLCMLILAAVWMWGGVQCLAGETAPAAVADKPVSILEGKSPWRMFASYGYPFQKTAEGIVEAKPKPSRYRCKCSCNLPGHMLAFPPETWITPDFDDGAWVRRVFAAQNANGEGDGRAGGGFGCADLRQICLRGKFLVTDPEKAGDLGLSMSYRGGVVVYLNGKEVGRGNMKEGKVEQGAAAELYPDAAFMKEDGKAWNWWNDRDTIGKESYPLRVRSLKDVKIPAAALRKGVNVVAVEIHAAPHASATEGWATAGLVSFNLESKSAEGIAPNVTRPPGIQAWTTQLCSDLFPQEQADPGETVRPIVLAGARNGSYSGRIAVGSDQPIRNIKAQATDLAGPNGAKIPAAAIRVGYGVFEGRRVSGWGGALPYEIIPGIPYVRDDAALAAPPAEVPKGPNGAIQTVYVTVTVPKTAAAGDYAGTMTVTLDAPAGTLGASDKPITVPVKVKVIDWTLPDPAAGDYFAGLIQCPEAVANTYGVPRFSDKHLELLEKSFDLIAKLGGDVVYLNLAAESEYGNDESLVLWIRGKDGKYTHDFSRVEKYLDVALKKLGKPRFVVCYVLDPAPHVSCPANMRRDYPRFSLLDPATGKIETMNGPTNGTPESLEFWKPVLTKTREILEKRGVADRMLIGDFNDYPPTKEVVEVFHQCLPGVGWQSTRHGPTGAEFLPAMTTNVPVMYHANVWGSESTHDPAYCERSYGWNYRMKPSLRTWLDRDTYDASTISHVRNTPEQTLLANRRGFGQNGADFWPFKDANGKVISGTYCGRFPATKQGNLELYVGQLLYPGPNGAEPSLRYIMTQENIQECEARIFLEKLLIQTPCPLPEAVAKKCQAVLDERARWHNISRYTAELQLYWGFYGWEERTARLYEAAAEAAQALKAGEKT